MKTSMRKRPPIHIRSERTINSTEPALWLDETTKIVENTLDTLIKQSRGWKDIQLGKEHVTYVKAILTKSWTKMARQAATTIKQRHQILKNLIPAQKKLADLHERLKLAPHIVRKLHTLADRPDWDKLYPLLKRALRKHGLQPKQIDALISRMNNKQETASIMARIASDSVSMLETVQKETLASLIGAILARAVAKFNNAVTGDRSSLAEMADWCRRTENALEDGERVIWQELKKNGLLTASHKAAKLRIMAETSLDRGLVLAASIAMKRREHKPSTPEEQRMALRIGNDLRILLRVITLGHQFSTLESWSENQHPAREWIHAAKILKFDATTPAKSHKVIEFNDLKRIPYGTTVTVTGVVDSLNITHKKRKAVSTARLLDSKGNFVTITLPYIKLDSGGFVPGASVSVTGVLSEKVEWLKESPIIVIDRLNYEQLSKKSWRDWVTAELRDIFDVVPHGLAIEWSWEHGINGAGNLLRYETWHNFK